MKKATAGTGTNQRSRQGQLIAEKGLAALS
jgi:hypothetical protein